MNCFFVIGNDNRTLEVKNILDKEKRVTDDISIAKYVLCPTPFTKDNIVFFKTNIDILETTKKIKNKILFAGSINKDMRNLLESNGVKYYDLMEYEDIAILNAIPTSEGAIEEAMKISDITLSGSNVLVLGFGRIGKILSKMLSGIGANVYCEARNKKDLALIKALGYNKIDLDNLNEKLPYFDFIFNTIPYMILDKNRLNLVNKDAYIIDLASIPGGIDFDYANKINIKCSHALALPSKVAPRSSAKYFKNKIDEVINCNGG